MKNEATMMHILALSGSLRARSTNTMLVETLSAFAPAHMHIRIYRGLADLPHFNPDLDGENAPDSVKSLREELRIADGVLICTPEYAYGMPGSLKNALDWVVSSGEFYNKPVVTMSAAPNQLGAARAHAALIATLGALSAVIPAAGSLTIPLVNIKIDSNGAVIDLETQSSLKALLVILGQAVDKVNKTDS